MKINIAGNSKAVVVKKQQSKITGIKVNTSVTKSFNASTLKKRNGTITIYPDIIYRRFSIGESTIIESLSQEEYNAMRKANLI